MIEISPQRLDADEVRMLFCYETQPGELSRAEQCV